MSLYPLACLYLPGRCVGLSNSNNEVPEVFTTIADARYESGKVEILIDRSWYDIETVVGVWVQVS